MKKIYKIVLSLLIPSMFLAGCSDMLEVNSNRLAKDDYGKLSDDLVYSTFGVLSQLQKLGDSYVLLGELRGDLMTTTDLSDVDLKDIENFSATTKNPYANLSDYYAVINNCNYILSKIDTSAIDNNYGQKLNLGHYAAIKSIRAWTYMQIALNFKTAKYYDNPIVTVEDSQKNYPEYSLEELADILIADLLPLKEVPFSRIGNIGSYDSNLSYFPIKFLLGDLYLWKGDYQNAAQQYHDLMFDDYLTVNKNNSTVWKTINNIISTSADINWRNSFIPGNQEVLSTITCPTQYGQHFALDSLNFQGKIAPSNAAISNWDSQIYFLNEISNSQGDLRKYGSLWWQKDFSKNSNKTTQYNVSEDVKSYRIFKYLFYDQNIVVYRSSLLYLRYAEAVNRLNKPNLAFAVLKYGLNPVNMRNTKIVPANEKDSLSQSFMSFSDNRFELNAGTRMRGLGNADKDTTFFTIPRKDTMKDSVLYVENLIQKELALETAFEGNRFHDLMRFTLRRIKNGEGDESYLADPISAKHVGRESVIREKLMHIDNWYIKK